MAQQVVRLGSLPVDGLIIYDIQDETERISTPRPFPFLPTLGAEAYAHEHLGPLRCLKLFTDASTEIRPTDSSGGWET